jgi:hypothetical protein
MAHTTNRLLAPAGKHENNTTNPAAAAVDPSLFQISYPPTQQERRKP